MARKDVIEYFLDVQDQYLQMQGIVTDLQEELETGYIDQEHYNNVIEDINIMRNNYERIAYIIMLLNKPNRRSKLPKEEKANKKLYDYLDNANASGKMVISENTEGLKHLRDVLKELRMQNGTEASD